MLCFPFRLFIPFLLLTLGILPPTASSAVQYQPGWADVFIHLNNYATTYEKPVIDKGKRTYRQKAVYTWSGGRYEILGITMARDPAFKKRFSPETLKKEKSPPNRLAVNKKTAWLWEFPAQPGKIDQVVRRLVVVLGEDGALILEQKGFGADLAKVAEKFDPARVEKILAVPPRIRKTGAENGKETSGLPKPFPACHPELVFMGMKNLGHYLG